MSFLQLNRRSIVEDVFVVELAVVAQSVEEMLASLSMSFAWQCCYGKFQAVKELRIPASTWRTKAEGYAEKMAVFRVEVEECASSPM